MATTESGMPFKLGDRLVEALIEWIPVAIIVKEAQDLQVVLINRAGEELFGVARQELLCKSNTRRLPAALAAARSHLDREVLRTGKPLETPEEELVSPSRGLRGLRTWRIPIPDAVGRPAYLLEILEDITDRKTARSLAGCVAHDLNNLLQVVLSSAQSLLEQLDPAAPERGDAEDIMATGRRARELTRQLEDFSRQRVQRPGPLDLNLALENSSRLLVHLAAENVTLVLQPGGNLGRVFMDACRLEQVISNLATNARDAMPAGGSLTIRTAHVELDEGFVHAHPGTGLGPYVLMTVSDTGTGMTPEVAARIFDPYFTTKPTGKGTGLGLATVYRIVREAGGHISVESAPGLGTTFRIYLPCCDPVSP